MTSKVVLDEVVQAFAAVIGGTGESVVVAGGEIYPQPSVYLSLHLVCMHADGWTTTTYDDLAVVSGSSALFAYQSGVFAPKYAHLFVDMDESVLRQEAVMPIPRPGEARHRLGIDERIARVTGYGYAWSDFETADEAWELIRDGVDQGRASKGWYWENVLFAGYEDAPSVTDRRVLAITDGPDTYSRWWTWREFHDWVDMFDDWGQGQLGRHTEVVETARGQETVERVVADLVAWSVSPQAVVRAKFPQAVFGLEGMERYAHDCEDVDRIPDWLLCHDVNGQWPMRNSTSVFLRSAAAAMRHEETASLLLSAADAYRAAYLEWRDVYRLLGQDAPIGAGRDPIRRQSGAAGVKRAAEHERRAIGALQQVVGKLKEREVSQPQEVPTVGARGAPA